MYRKTYTYNDYNGVEKTETIYFNLTEEELTTMEMSTAGGFVESVQAIVATKDGPAIVKLFKDLIKSSYGIKTPEGRFRKSEAIFDDFVSTPLYSKIFMELATDADSASEFIMNVVPENLAREAKALEEKKKTLEGQEKNNIAPLNN